MRYLQLAYQSRVGGVTRAEVLLNLGREDSRRRLYIERSPIATVLLQRCGTST